MWNCCRRSKWEAGGLSSTVADDREPTDWRWDWGDGMSGWLSGWWGGKWKVGGGGGRLAPGWAPLGGDWAMRALAESASLWGGAEKSWASDTVYK